MSIHERWADGSEAPKIYLVRSPHHRILFVNDSDQKRRIGDHGEVRDAERTHQTCPPRNRSRHFRARCGGSTPEPKLLIFAFEIGRNISHLRAVRGRLFARCGKLFRSHWNSSLVEIRFNRTRPSPRLIDDTSRKRDPRGNHFLRSECINASAARRPPIAHTVLLLTLRGFQRTRAELRAEDPSLSDHALARHYGVTAPTVRKWRECDSTADRSHRPDTLHCTLTAAQEAVAMAIRARWVRARARHFSPCWRRAIGCRRRPRIRGVARYPVRACSWMWRDLGDCRARSIGAH
jgi:hypothetical protein